MIDSERPPIQVHAETARMENRTDPEMAELHVRRYGETDAPALIALFRASVRQLAQRDYDEAQTIAWAPDEIDSERFTMRLASSTCWVVEIAGRLAGFCNLEAYGHLDMLYVHPDFARQGVASVLLDQLEREAMRLGTERIYSEVSLTARPLFLARGFRELTRQTVIVHGVSMDNLRMEKTLAQP